MSVEYTVKFTPGGKNLVYYEVTFEGVTTGGQAMGLGQAMMVASELVYNKLQNEGRLTEFK